MRRNSIVIKRNNIVYYGGTHEFDQFKKVYLTDYDKALGEMQNGIKKQHYSWYIWPTPTATTIPGRKPPSQTSIDYNMTPEIGKRWISDKDIIDKHKKLLAVMLEQLNKSGTVLSTLFTSDTPRVVSHCRFLRTLGDNEINILCNKILDAIGKIDQNASNVNENETIIVRNDDITIDTNIQYIDARKFSDDWDCDDSVFLNFPDHSKKYIYIEIDDFGLNDNITIFYRFMTQFYRILEMNGTVNILLSRNAPNKHQYYFEGLWVYYPVPFPSTYTPKHIEGTNKQIMTFVKKFDIDTIIQSFNYRAYTTDKLDYRLYIYDFGYKLEQSLKELSNMADKQLKFLDSVKNALGEFLEFVSRNDNKLNFDEILQKFRDNNVLTLLSITEDEIARLRMQFRSQQKISTGCLDLQI